MKKELLMTPGPSQVPQQVAAAGAVPIIHHRSSEFKEIYGRLVKDLKKVFGTDGYVFVLGSSGTGALESAVVNSLCPGDSVVVCVTGKFGERFSKLCNIYGMKVTEINKEWGKAVTAAEVKAQLEKLGDVKAVFVTQSETSTGVLNPVDEIGPVADEAGALTIVDSVSSLGAVEMRMDEWKVDLVAAGSQKALMLPPGLSFLGVRGEKAWKAYERSSIPKFYFDMGVYKKTFDKKGDTPYTTSVSLCLSLEESLKMVLGEGLENVYARHAKLAAAARAAVKALGLKLFAERPSDIETVFAVPAGMDGNELVKVIREKYGVRVSGGQEPYKGKIVRIAHMGYATGHDVILAVSATEMALLDLGYKLEMGAGVRAAQEVLR